MTFDPSAITQQELLGQIADCDRELANICPFESESLCETITTRAYRTGNELHRVAAQRGWRHEAVRAQLLAARSIHGSRPRHGWRLASSARRAALDHGFQWEQYEADRVLASCAYVNGDFNAANEIGMRAVEGFRSIGDPEREVACLWNFRNVEYSLGRPDRELVVLASILSHDGLAAHPKLRYLAHADVARLLTDHRPDDPNIERHLDAADRLTAVSPNPLSRCCFYFSKIYYLVDRGESEIALPLALEFRSLAQRHGSIAGETVALSVLADCFDGLGDQRSFMEALLESLRHARRIGHNGAIACCLSSLGEMTFLEDPTTARQHLEEALATAKSAGLLSLEKRCSRMLAAKLEQIGAFDAAVKHMHRYIELQEETKASAFEHALRAIDLQGQVMTTERSLHALHVKSDRLKQELEKQASDAVSKSAALADQAGLIRNVHTIVEQILSSGNSPQQVIAELRRRVEGIPLPELHWQQLSDEFVKMFPDFLAKLRKRCPSITKTEERVCCLVRLNLSTRDMASLLNITERGVESCRYRIRRKARLTNRTSLQEYLSSI